MKLTLIQLRAFLAVADALSFTAAAERLRITQPSLSSTIRNLEASLGGRLFDRDTRKVRLTALGADCRRLAVRLLDEAERTEAELRSHVAGERGAIRIAALPNIFPTALKAGLAEFRALRPTVRLRFSDVTSDEAILQLRDDRADLAIVLQINDDPDLRYRFLAEHRFVALLPGAHPLAGRASITWADIEREDAVLLQSRDSIGLRIGHYLRDAGIATPATYRVNELSTAVALVDAGFGIGLMAHHSAEHALRPDLVMRDINEPSVVGALSMITLAARELSPPVALLQDILARNAPKSTRPLSF